LESFEEIYEKYFRKIYGFLYRLTGNNSLSEELTQQTLYNAFLHIDKFKGNSNVFTWLCSIAKNNWLAECNRQKRFQSSEEKEELASANNLEQVVIEKHMLELMRQEIKNLPEPYLSVFTLKISAELSYLEIAEEFGKSESWARVTFFRGKSMLVERMEKYK